MQVTRRSGLRGQKDGDCFVCFSIWKCSNKLRSLAQGSLQQFKNKKTDHCHFLFLRDIWEKTGCFEICFVGSTPNVKENKDQIKEGKCFSWCCFLQDQQPLSLVVTLRNVSFRSSTSLGKKQDWIVANAAAAAAAAALWRGRQHLHCSQQEVGFWQENPEMKICRGFGQESGLWLKELWVLLENHVDGASFQHRGDCQQKVTSWKFWLNEGWRW